MKTIDKAAIKYRKKIYTGFNHGECFQQIEKKHRLVTMANVVDQGFIDSDGNFIDRKQAMVIAKEANQLECETDKKTLISEDLYLYWLHKQAEQIAEANECNDDLELRLREQYQLVDDKDNTIKIKDMLIKQLEEQNDRLIKERDEALMKSGTSYIYCTINHGKFKSADKLFESYLQLEKEYTKSRQELSKKDQKIKILEEFKEKYPYKNDVIEKQYDEIKNAIDYLLTVEDKMRYCYMSSLNHSIDVLCEKHKARIRDIEGSICTIEKLEKQNNDYANSLTKVLSENESLVTRYTELEATNKKLMELKAKEMGEALSDAFNNFTVAIRNKLDKETILEYLRTHNQDKLKMLEGIKESIEDINNYLLKKGDITWAGSDKILDFIDCKIEQQKGDK